MKLSELSNSSLRIITSLAIFAIVGIAALLERYGIPFLHIHTFHAIRWLGVIVFAFCIYEMVSCVSNAPSKTIKKYPLPVILFLLWLVFVLISVYSVGTHIWIMLCLLMIIVGADVGGWLFGMLFGGDKLWERISEHKTWAGQIGGIICGTLMSVLYSKIFGTSLAGALWFGIGVSLLSQYGDLTASAIKRRLGIKDFGKLLPGHGGVLDRVDGWLYVLPLLWLLLK